MKHSNKMKGQKPPAYLQFGPIRPTLNNRGYAIESLNPYSAQYVSSAVSSTMPSLEVGAGYGFTSFTAAAQGAKFLIINELDELQLDVIEQESKKYPATKFTLLPGAVSKLALPANSLANILICRVTHYLTGDEIDITLQLFFQALQPGGKVFLVSETPYGASFRKFIPLFEKRKQQKERWPGYIENLKAYMSQYSENNPDAMHLLDPDTLHITFSNHGFIIEKCDYFARDEFPAELRLEPTHQHFGHESCGIIARKP